MKTIDQLLQAVVDAEQAVLDELARLHPIGSPVTYRLRDGVPEQSGTVTGHIGGRDGAMRILLGPSRNDPRGIGRYETTLPYRKIVR